MARQGDPDWVPGFYDYIKELKRNSSILERQVDPNHFICKIHQVKSIRHRIMHFKNGKLEGATGPDITLLKSVLDKVKMLSKD